MAGYIRYDGKPLTKRYKHNESLKEWNVLATALKVQTALYEDRNDLITTSCQDPTFWKTLRPQLTLRDTWEELQSGQRADWLKCSESTLPLRLHPNFGKSVMEVEPDGWERDKLGELCILDCKWQWRSKRPFPPSPLCLELAGSSTSADRHTNAIVYVVNPLRPWFFHLWIQRTMNQNYLEKEIFSSFLHVEVFLSLSFSSKQLSMTSLSINLHCIATK